MEKSWLLTNSTFKAKIIGKLLGDGCITLQERRKPRFQFIHVASDFGWSNYCYTELADMLPLNPPKYKIIKDSRLKSGYSYSYYVQSKTSNIITYLRSLWYPNGIKEIPFESLNEWFSLQSLAWWYMDDGHLKQSKNKPQKIILSTESFSQDENRQLISLLNEKYNLHFKLDKQNRLIIYDQYQIYYFLYLVTPHLHASMHRKIINSFEYKFNIQPKRTTIYLPATISIKHPTKEINNTLKGLEHLIHDYKKDIFYDTHKRKNIYDSAGEHKGYQIVLTKENLSKLLFLKRVTGLNFSELGRMCYLADNFRSLTH